jgi:hypothetical protein
MVISLWIWIYNFVLEYEKRIISILIILKYIKNNNASS